MGEWFQVRDGRDRQSRRGGQKSGTNAGGTPFRPVSGNRRQKLSVRGDGAACRKTRGQGSLRCVKIGESPAGKAIKFLHRGAYDDIDSTYELITAFLDEKGLESQNRFIEEYLTDTAEPDDANLEADIYVFLK